MDAVLMLWVSLVQGARTTLQMWLRIRPRNWHTQSEVSALPQATSGNHLHERTHTRGVILGMETDPLVRVRREGGGPVLRAAQTHDHRSATATTNQTDALILSLSKDAGDAVRRVARMESAPA